MGREPPMIRPSGFHLKLTGPDKAVLTRDGAASEVVEAVRDQPVN